MHNKMKSLESRYIDLANFYKKELISKNKQQQQSHKYLKNNRSNQEDLQ